MPTLPGRRPSPGLETCTPAASNGFSLRSAISGPSLIKSSRPAPVISLRGDIGRLISSRCFPQSGKAPGSGQAVRWPAAMLQLSISTKVLRLGCPRVIFTGLLDPSQSFRESEDQGRREGCMVSTHGISRLAISGRSHHRRVADRYRADTRGASRSVSWLPLVSRNCEKVGERAAVPSNRPSPDLSP